MDNNQIGSDPTTWAISTWLLAIVMAMSGGLINVMNTYKTGERSKINVMSFIGEFFTAGFVGVGVFMALLSYDYSMGLAAFSACVSGHYGTRLLFKIEFIIEYKLDDVIQVKNNQKVKKNNNEIIENNTHDYL